MSNRMRRLLILLLMGLGMGGVLSVRAADTPSPATDERKPNITPAAGYLFAHMTKSDYGHLYYSLSRDGLHWTPLNGGKRVHEEYRGHPDITRGHDGRYYLTGGSNAIELWVSPDLVAWSRLRTLEPDLTHDPNFKPAEKTYGAPKITWDADTRQYLLTWHTSQNEKLKELPEHYWAGQRTLYVTSPDLQTFSEPKRLFEFEMATIDVIVRNEAGRYYAFIKDERYPAFDWPTGKTIRVCQAPALTGPYTEPGPKISPNFREAPTLIPRHDGKGWRVFYEQYPGLQYGCSTAPTLAGPWYEEYYLDYTIPAETRHGCILPIDSEAVDRLTKAYGSGSQAQEQK